MRALVLSAILGAVLVHAQPLPFGPLDASQPVSFWIGPGEGTPGFDAGDPDLVRLALDTWSRETRGRLKFVETSGAADALIRVRWVSANEGFFGEAQRIMVRGRPGSLVHIMPDVGSLGQPLAGRAEADRLLRDTIVYLTCLHELGHAVGLPHTRDYADIMYSFGFGGDLVEYFLRYRRLLDGRADIRRQSGVSDGDRVALARLYPLP